MCNSIYTQVYFKNYFYLKQLGELRCSCMNVQAEGGHFCSNFHINILGNELTVCIFELTVINRCKVL